MTPIIKELVSVSPRSPAVLHIDISPQMSFIVARNLCKQKSRIVFQDSQRVIFLSGNLRVVTLYT